MGYNEWLDIDVLEDYLDGKLDGKAIHQIEKLSLEDPFVAEALEGLSKSTKRTQSLSLLQKQLQERVAQKPIEKKMWTITSHRLSIGAAAAVLFITVSVLFWMKGNKRQEILANNEVKKVDVTIAPQVAIKNNAELAPVVENKISSERISGKKKANQTIEAKIIALKETPIIAVNDNAVTASSIMVEPSAARQNKVAEEVGTISLARAKKVDARVAAMSLPNKANGIGAGYFSGKVISKENGMPIPGAIVNVAGVDSGTITDKNGEFKLRADSAQNEKLTIGYVGFKTAEIGVKSNQPVNVVLENSNSSLQEVVIAKNVVTSMPLGGWNNYQAYIKSNNKLVKNDAAKSEVELSFEITKDGSVKEIKVLKSAGKEMDNEAIRLVKNGPNWLYDSAKKNIGYLKIQF